MKTKKILSSIIIGTMLMALTVAAVSTVSAGAACVIKGTLYIDGVIAGEGDAEVQFIFPDHTYSIVTFDPHPGDPNSLNYAIDLGFDRDLGEVGDFLVLVGYNYLVPYDNQTFAVVDVSTNWELGHVDLHVIAPENNPPNTPSNPDPYDGETDVFITADLGWDGGDPDGDDVEYDVYFDIVNPPVTLVDTVDITSYDPGILSQDTTYYWQIIARDSLGAERPGQVWSFTTASNSPPYPPTLVNPTSGSTVGSETSATLQVQVTDPDGDTMDVSFYTGSGGLIGTTTGITSGSTASYTWSGHSAGTTYSWYAVANDGEFNTQSATWNFKTKAQSSGPPSNPSNPSNPSPPTNAKPVADLSAGEPYVGFAGELILFDGSLSHEPTIGESITTWFWTFGDGTNDSGETVTHSYDEPGTYDVTLTVTNNNGVTSNPDTTTAEILQPNNPPETPEITGESEGTKNTEYTYTAVSTDLDNDSIQYTFVWGDGTSDTVSTFLDNGTAFETTHTWTSAGKYIIEVTAFDNESESDPAEFTVYIDAIAVDDIGYLTDDDGDGIYDTFHANDGTTTDAVLQEDGTYLIDEDGDGIPDWIFNPETGELTAYSELEEEGLDLTLIILAVIIIIIFLAAVAYIAKGSKGKKKK